MSLSCPLHLLYIEPGVFGELRPKPAMPVPPKSPVFESVIAIIAQTQTVTNGDLDRQGSPLNLTVPADKTTIPDAISDNIDTASIVADEPIKDTYCRSN